MTNVCGRGEGHELAPWLCVQEISSATACMHRSAQDPRRRCVLLHTQTWVGERERPFC